jgi:hypothetical protein
MSVPSGKYVVGVGHVDEGTSFDAVLIAHVKTDVVLNIELPQAFVVL